MRFRASERRGSCPVSPPVAMLAATTAAAHAAEGLCHPRFVLDDEDSLDHFPTGHLGAHERPPRTGLMKREPLARASLRADRPLSNAPSSGLQRGPTGAVTPLGHC
jgi:hypothetical protein